MSDKSFDLFEKMEQTAAGRAILAEFHKQSLERDGGYERSQQWTCEDGWIVEYTTTKVEGGPLDGKYAVMAYKPYGTGARGGRRTARNWQRVYIRGFVKRKTARARAETLYWKHNPTRARKYGKAS
jgi:hypothetical protein